MYTGIVEELGEVVDLTAVSGESPDSGTRITVRGPLVTSDARHGDSISVNGVCLTVVDTSDGSFTADVMAETLDRSGLGELRTGSPVNLERPARLSDRLGGHLVQGHVDGTGRILGRDPLPGAEILRISLPPGLARYVVEKGSITVDGASLTVVEAEEEAFTVSLIPTTLELTTLGRKNVGDLVNLEVDIVAKYVERLLAANAGKGPVE